MGSEENNESSAMLSQIFCAAHMPQITVEALHSYLFPRKKNGLEAFTFHFDVSIFTHIISSRKC